MPLPVSSNLVISLSLSKNMVSHLTEEIDARFTLQFLSYSAFIPIIRQTSFLLKYQPVPHSYHLISGVRV